jgi:hypothetical protein
VHFTDFRFWEQLCRWYLIIGGCISTYAYRSWTLTRPKGDDFSPSAYYSHFRNTSPRKADAAVLLHVLAIFALGFVLYASSKRFQ